MSHVILPSSQNSDEAVEVVPVCDSVIFVDVDTGKGSLSQATPCLIASRQLNDVESFLINSLPNMYFMALVYFPSFTNTPSLSPILHDPTLARVILAMSSAHRLVHHHRAIHVHLAASSSLALDRARLVVVIIRRLGLVDAVQDVAVGPSAAAAAAVPFMSV